MGVMTIVDGCEGQL